MIRRRDPGHFGACYSHVDSPMGGEAVPQSVEPSFFFFFAFDPLDQIAGPVIISAFLFFAVLANFIFRGTPQPTRMIKMIFRLCFFSPIVPLSMGFSPRTVRPFLYSFFLPAFGLSHCRNSLRRKQDVTIPGLAFMTQYL